MDKMNRSKEELVQSFPVALHDDVRTALSILPEDRYSHNWSFFSLHLGEQPLSIPRQIYFDPPLLQTVQLTERQSQLLDCSFTRHPTGRQNTGPKLFRNEMIRSRCF
jgi:hypothetical protein